MAAVISGLTVHTARMEAVASNSWATATGLADEIVARTPLSFRQAHHIVARLVRDALSAGVSASAVTSEMLDDACRNVRLEPIGLPGKVIQGALEAHSFVASRSSLGGTAVSEVDKLGANAREQMTLLLERQAARRSVIEQAAAMLCQAQSKWLPTGEMDNAR
jgi:argininosuccinate lyase